MKTFRAIGTKVSPEFHEVFRNICEKKGMKPYKVVQLMVDTFVRYTDDRHRLSQTMERVMGAFEHMNGWENAFNLADASVKGEVLDAIYFIGSDKREGRRAVMVSRNTDGTMEQTSNIQDIIEMAIETLLPELYRRLRALAVDLECSSLLDLLFLMVDAHTIQSIDNDIRDVFSDNRRHDFGGSVEYGERTKRKKNRDIDAEEWKPFGYEK